MKTFHAFTTTHGVACHQNGGSPKTFPRNRYDELSFTRPPRKRTTAPLCGAGQIRKARLCTLLVLGLAVVQAGCGTDDPGGSKNPPLSWMTCYETFECATMNAPIDYNDPDAGQVEISLLRAHASEPEERLGVLFVNFGGPGAPSIETVVNSYPTWRLTASDLVNRFDIIAMDPRGVGLSTPIDCVDDTDIDVLRELDCTPELEVEWSTFDSSVRRFWDGCMHRTGGELLVHVDTENVARDMDRVRERLGEPMINFMGFSYGTLLGATYVSLFPSRVRAFVLDSVVAPFDSIYAFVTVMAIEYERALERFFEVCGADPACTFHGGEGGAGVATAFDSLRVQLEMEAATTDSGRSVGSSQLTLALWFGLRGARFDLIPDALAEAEAGHGDLLLSMADNLFLRAEDGSYSGLFESFFVIQLLDMPCPVPFDRQTLESSFNDLASEAPRMAEMAAMVLGFCMHRPVQLEEPQSPIGAPSAPPLLLFNGLRDPQTPHASAERLLLLLDNGSYLVSYDGEGHGVIFNDFCALQVSLDYLIDPSVPPATLLCP